MDYKYLMQFSKKQDLNAFLSSWFNEEQADLPIEVPYN